MKPRPYAPYAYSPIIRRPPFAWPNGARVALWLIPNIEFFALDEKIPGFATNAPDIPNWAVRDYGNRIGIFRMMEVMDRYGVRGTVALNSDVCRMHPEIIEECLKRDWELMGHNESNSRRLTDVPADEERGVITRTVETIAQASGRKVRGWLGSGLQETWNTLEHLADAGVDYVADWVSDDQPVEMTLEDGRKIMSVPYGYELNDKPAFERRNRTPEEFTDMVKRSFDVLWREGETQARVMAIALHPYITGVPHRIDALDKALDYVCAHEGVWRATGAEIADAGRQALAG